MGTLAKEIHTSPGTTFSSSEDLHNYRPAEKACITLKEFDCWLAEIIVCDYHQRIHSTLKMSPIAKWTEGIFGKGDRPGRGYPAVFTAYACQICYWSPKQTTARLRSPMNSAGPT